MVYIQAKARVRIFSGELDRFEDIVLVSYVLSSISGVNVGRVVEVEVVFALGGLEALVVVASVHVLAEVAHGRVEKTTSLLSIEENRAWG